MAAKKRKTTKRKKTRWVKVSGIYVTEADAKRILKKAEAHFARLRRMGYHEEGDI